MKVTGIEGVLRKLGQIHERQVRNLVKASEDTSRKIAATVRSVDHGLKSERPEGARVHALGRFQNQTGNLRQSILQQDSVIDGDTIVGNVTAGISKDGQEFEYAAYVEAKYPYMYPAVVECQHYFVDRVKKAMQV